MPVLTVRFEEETGPILEDLETYPGCTVHHLGNNAEPIIVSVLPKGMTSGKPSIMMGFKLPNGDTVIAETSARLFVTAADMIRAKYPEILNG